MSKKLSKFAVYSDSSYGDPGLGEVIVDYPDRLLATLKQHLLAGEYKAMQALLSQKYIYPEKVKTTEESGFGGWGGWSITYDWYYTRPGIEVLFHDHRAKLIDFLAELMKLAPAAYQEAFQAFTESFKGTDLNPSALFSWDDKVKAGLKKHLAEMQAYGSSLEKQGVNKGQVANSLAQTLAASVDGFDPSLMQQEPRPHQLEQLQEENAHKTPLTILSFKLSLLDTLHSKDDLFAEHRGWKKILTNIATILLTGGLANIVNKAYTGNWMFFNKTTTQEKVMKIEQAMYPRGAP